MKKGLAPAEGRTSDARPSGAEVMTVLGPVDAGTLGPTLMHEHMFCDDRHNFLEPIEPALRELVDSPVEIHLLGLLRRRPFSVCRANVTLDDEPLAVAELLRYERAGGRTVVDVTTIGLGRNPLALARVARATGLNIIQGTGIYIEPSHPDWVRERSVDDIAELFVHELRDGIDGTGIRAGIIGEIGTSGVPRDAADYRDSQPTTAITDDEERVLRAAGRAARATGVAVSVHLDARGRVGSHVIDVLEEELSADRIILGHLDTIQDIDYHLELAARGVFIEYDCFGRDYYSDEQGIAWGHDSQRAEFLVELVSAGHEDQLLLSHDVCFKMDLRAYGGYGYDHILTTVVPMLGRMGVGPDLTSKFLVTNPRRALVGNEGRAEP